MTKIFREQLLPNFMVNAHGQGQVGDAMALPAAMLETIAHSHGEEIVLLPCLPKAWPEGEIHGMGLRGGYTLDMCWNDGKVVKAILKKAFPGKDKKVRVASAGEYRISYCENGDISVQKVDQAV